MSGTDVDHAEVDDNDAGGRELLDRRETWNGFGNALSRAIELVATPVLFALAGWYLDRWLGTRPVFTLSLFLVAIVGMGARMYYAYVAEMQAHEEAAPWKRK